MAEFRPADWPEKYISGQSARSSSRVTLSPSYTKQFSSSIDLVVTRLNMRQGTNTLPSIFSADLSKHIIVNLRDFDIVAWPCNGDLHIVQSFRSYSTVGTRLAFPAAKRYIVNFYS